MKTLRKTLCVVLSVVMLVGILAFSASATSFTDDKDITAAYKEAVEVLTGLKVINGMDNNNFKPKDTLTREQATKIIAFIMLGSTGTDDLTKNAKQVFDDVDAARWSAGYIQYLSSKGVVDGVGNNMFDPNGGLSSAAFEKMLLVALGYKADVEGLTGDSWAQNTALLAKEAGIRDDNIAITDQGSITREEACQLAYLALKGGMVKYTGGTTVTIGGVPITTGATREELKIDGVQATAYQYYYDGKDIITDIVTGNQATGLTCTTVGLGAAAKNFNYTTDLSLIGHKVNVYYKTAYVSATSKGTTYAITDQTTVVDVPSTMTDAQLTAALKAAGVTFTAASSGSESNITAEYQIADGVVKNDDYSISNAADLIRNNVESIFVYDGAVYGVKFADTYVASKVTAISTTSGKESITLAGVGAIANNATTDNINAYDGIAVDDVVVYTMASGIYNVTKAKTVEGKVTLKSGTTYTVDGTAYAASGLDISNTGLTSVDPDFINTYTLYLTPSGKYFAAVAKTTISTSAGILYTTLKFTKDVAEVKDDFGTVTTEATTLYYVQGVDSTGKEIIYQVTEDMYNAVTATEGKTTAPNTLYSVTTAYSSTLKATVATLTTIPAVADKAGTTASVALATTHDAVTASAAKFADGYYYGTGVKFIYVSGTGSSLKVTVKDGKQAIAANAAAVCYGTKAAKTDTNATVSVVFIGAAESTTVTSSDIVFGFESADSTTTVPYTKADGTVGTAYAHTVYMNGVKTTVTTEDATLVNGFKTFSKDSVTGLYTFTDCKTGVANPATFTNVYGTMISTSAGLVDADASSAKIVDLVNTASDATPVTTLAGILSGKYQVAYIGTQADGVSIIYIVATAKVG